jgi:hypothetical protein
MTKWFLAFMLAFPIVAGAATNWTVSSTVRWELSSSGTSYSNVGECEAAAERLAAGSYKCVPSGAVVVAGKGATVVSDPPPPTSPPTSPPASSSSSVTWGYFDGTFNWGGDYSWNVSLNYQDTSGQPLSGAHDLKVSLTGQWGGWQPYMCTELGEPLSACVAQYDYPLAGFTYLTVSLKPTIANQQWSAQFVAVGDTGIPCNYGNPAANGAGVNVLAYGPAPVAGQWGTYKIPLSAFCVGPGTSNVNVYKFHIQDQTGLSSNTWYVDNVGFE